MDLFTILAVVGAAATIIGLGMIWYQLRLQSKLARFAALRGVHEQIGRLEFRRALRCLHQATPDEMKHLDDEGSADLREAFELVTGLYDLMGARLQDGILPKDGTLKTEWKVLAVLWPKVEAQVRARGKGRGVPYKEHFEWLFRQAKDYQDQHYRDSVPRPNVGEVRRELIPSSEDTVLHQGFNLELWRHRTGWEYVTRARGRGGVTIVPVTPDQEVIFVEQYRVPLKCSVIELPSGLVGDEAAIANESAKDAAMRELLEETGHECERLSCLARGPLLPGLTSEVNELFLAEGVTRRVTKTGGAPAEHELGAEIAAVHCVPVSQVLSWLQRQRENDREIDLRVYAGLFFLPEPLRSALHGHDGGACYGTANQITSA